MDKIKLTQKEFDELYAIDTSDTDKPEIKSEDNTDKPEEEFLTEEELAQDKALEETL